MMKRGSVRCWQVLKKTTLDEKQQMKNSISSVKDFGMSNPTRRGYQFTKRGSQTKKKVKVCQGFPMLGLGVSLRLINFQSHIFYSSAFQHNSSVPAFIHEEKVFYFENPYVHILPPGVVGTAVKHLIKKKLLEGEE